MNFSKQESPDFKVIGVHGGDFYIECTSCHLSKISTDSEHKLARVIRRKNKKPYKAVNVALFIEFSELLMSFDRSNNLTDSGLADYFSPYLQEGEWGAIVLYAVIYHPFSQLGTATLSYMRFDSEHLQTEHKQLLNIIKLCTYIQVTLLFAALF